MYPRQTLKICTFSDIFKWQGIEDSYHQGPSKQNWLQLMFIDRKYSRIATSWRQIQLGFENKYHKVGRNYENHRPCGFEKPQ